VPARRIICRGQDLDDSDSVLIVCRGWASSVVMLSDGNRQILSFLLSGDLVSATFLLEPWTRCLIEAITEVNYRAFNRSALRGVLFKFPVLLEKFSEFWIADRKRADQLIVDLGCRAADERIARLILGLAERLAQRGNTSQTGTPRIEMDFPLRHHHIADAVGLTPVHVNKVLSAFRRSGLIDISDRSLTILDPAEFGRVAHAR
jgi:CRP/FNR family transcriptional regulator, anaerobic regulatory protein